MGIRPTTVAAGALLVAVTVVFVLTGRFSMMAAADTARDAAGSSQPPPQGRVRRELSD